MSSANPSAGALVCTQCGFANPLINKFCQGCGQKIAGSAANGLTCSACGATATPGSRFCEKCGKSLAARRNPRSSPLAPL